MRETRRALFLCVGFAAGVATAETVETTSPSGGIALAIDWDGRRASYDLKADGETIASAAEIGVTVDGRALPSGGAAPDVKRASVRDSFEPPVPVVARRIEDVYNQTTIDFGDVLLVVRVYDDGAAFRWVLATGREEVVVDAERFSVRVASEAPVYLPIPNGEGYFSHQESWFKRSEAAKADPKRLACVPLLFAPRADLALLVTDVDVAGYPGLWLQHDADGRFVGRLPEAAAADRLEGERDLIVKERHPYLATTSGDRPLPWRAFVVASPKDLLCNTLCDRLAPRSRLANTEWIRPGKVMWDWWHDRNLGEQPFEVGTNQETFASYIDFAADQGIPYVLIDEGWASKEQGPTLMPKTGVDIDELVARGRRDSVGLLLWMTAHALRSEMDEAFDRFSRWGIAGIKVDFMQRDDQPMMEFCEEVARKAAEHELIVVFHGGSKPTGLHHEYPNVLAHESVLGLEQAKFGYGGSPDIAVQIPFIRSVVGPVDYTPGAMDNYWRTEFKPSYENPGSQGTRCQQLAMYVVYPTSLPMLADSPMKYAAGGESFEFMKRVPTTWDESHAVYGEIGAGVAIARRKGDRWWLAAMTNWEAREVDCDLAFLGDGAFTATVFSDVPPEKGRASEYRVDTREVDAGKTMTLALAPGGGAVVEFAPR